MFLSEDPSSPEIMTIVQPKWFSSNDEHYFSETNGLRAPHLFFDIAPEFSMNSRLVNAVIVTPEKSSHEYQVDLVSGQRYFYQNYCKDDSLSFSIGYIPRILDQLGGPQKVIVFGNPQKILRTMDYSYFRVRLIGAYIESFCPEGYCEDKSSWLSRLVFIAVDSADDSYDKINSIERLAYEMEWKKVKNELLRIQGANKGQLSKNEFFRIGELLNFNDSFEFFKKHSIVMTKNELEKIQTSCTALYEKLWKEVGVDRAEDRPVKTISKLNEKIKLIQELKSKGLPVGFAQRFQRFTKKYFNEMTTCNRFVYAGNLQKNPEKFWFLNFIGFFYKLHREGYYFDCVHNSWQRNVFNNRGALVYDFREDIDKCDEGDIDSAMSLFPTFLRSLRENNKDFYRFIDYDNHTYGTHKKLYSWVKMSSRQVQCGEDEVFTSETLSGVDMFPDDVKWIPRKTNDIQSDMKIIY
jgi:hypothetical protein